MIDILNFINCLNINTSLILGENHAYSNQKIGLFFFADGSIGFIIEVRGNNLITYSNEELFQEYKKILNFIIKDIDVKFKKGTQAFYQYIYIPDFNFTDFIKKYVNVNFYETDFEYKEIYMKEYDKKITDLKKKLEELDNIIKFIPNLNDNEKKEVTIEIANIKAEIDKLLQKYTFQQISVNMLKKFYNILNKETVKMLKSKVLGKVKRHKYYLTVRLIPDYSLEIDREEILQLNSLNIEDYIVEKKVRGIIEYIVLKAVNIVDSLPYGGAFLDIDDSFSFLYRFLGLPAYKANSQNMKSRLFPFPMLITDDKIIVENVPLHDDIPVYNKHNELINYDLKQQNRNLIDILITGYTITTLPDPGKADFTTGIDFITGLDGDYSVVFSFFREDNKETKRRINNNRKVFEFICSIPFLGKKFFSEEAREIKARVFKEASLNLELGIGGDIYRMACHVVLRKAIPVLKESIPSDLKAKKYYDRRTFVIQNDFFKKIGGGITAIKENDSLPEIFFKSMYPLSFDGWSLLERYISLYAPSLSALLPFHVEPEGMKEAGLILETPTCLYNHNHFALPGAKNYLIVGGTGSGKTFLEVNRLIRLHGVGSMRFIFIDRGDALSRAVKFLNGQNIKLRMTKNYKLIENKLNPFVVALKDVYQKESDYDEYIQSIREFLVGLLCSITNREDDNIAISCFTRLLDEELIGNSNRLIYSETGDASYQITFTDIYEYLMAKKNGKDSEGVWREFLANGEVIQSVYNFTRNGLYGSLFDDYVRKPLIESSAVSIDFEGLASEKISQIALAIINSYIWNVIMGTGGFIPAIGKKYRYTDVAFDEVWKTLQTKIGQQTIETGARTFRKHGGGLGILTQSAGDIGESGIKNALLANIQNLFIMSTQESDVPNLKEVLKFSDAEVDIVRNLKYKYGVYNQFYYKCLNNINRDLSTVLILRPLAITYAIVTSDAIDKAFINLLQQKFVEESGDGDNIAYMKAVVLFSKIFPSGVQNYPNYEELMTKSGGNNDYFLKEVLERNNYTTLKHFDLEKELEGTGVNYQEIL